MPSPTLNIQPLLDQAKAAGDDYRRTNSYSALLNMANLYSEVNKALLDEMKQLASSAGSSPPPSLQIKIQVAMQAGDNPPPGLLAKIQIATQAYQSWMTALKGLSGR